MTGVNTLVDFDQVVEMGHSSAAVDDPTPTAFATNLRMLVDSINSEARLSARGQAAVTWMLSDAIRKRIQISQWWSRDPNLGAQPIEEPIFLTGLPRSGTTYFQYLFDREPAMRMLRTWEGDNPCPPPAVDPESAAERRAACVEAHARRRQEDGGAMDAFHLSDPDGPQECVMIVDQTFANAGNYWTFAVPSYFERIVDTVDMRACYQHHKRALQVLQWQAPPTRWALKWPCHLLGMKEIVEVYPDARFVVTHRDPVQALASNCSFSTYLRSQFSDHVDRVEVGRQMRYMVGQHIRGLVDFDANRGPDVLIAHVDYAQVVDDPDRAMADVYATLGLELTPSVRESIVAWRRDNPPGRRGAHKYDLSDYGLDADEVAEEYSFYTDRFDIPREVRAT